MKIDARPFFKLSTPKGAVQCLRPDFNGRSVGVGASGGGMGTVGATATHTVTVFSPLPADLTPNAVVTIDDTSPAGRYRVLQVAPEPSGATVYLSNDPAQTAAAYKPSKDTDAPKTGQRLPYA